MARSEERVSPGQAVEMLSVSMEMGAGRGMEETRRRWVSKGDDKERQCVSSVGV